MLKTLHPFYDKLGQKKFKYLGPALSFITDIGLILYINKYMLPKLSNHQLISLILVAQGISPSEVSRGNIKMIQDMMISSMSLAFVFILIFNFIIYILAMKEIKYPVKYVHGYCLSAALLSVLELATYIFNGQGFNFVTFITMISYFIVWQGYSYFKKSSAQ